MWERVYWSGRGRSLKNGEEDMLEVLEFSFERIC